MLLSACGLRILSCIYARFSQSEQKEKKDDQDKKLNLENFENEKEGTMQHHLHHSIICKATIGLQIAVLFILGCNGISGVNDFSFEETDGTNSTETDSHSEIDSSASSDSQFDTGSDTETDTDTDTNTETDSIVDTDSSVGSDAPTGELGSGCSSSEICISGFCADGICCDQACNGSCQACGGDGLCDDVPVEDASCEVVSCPTTTCTLYTVPTCKSFGVCATENDCVPEIISAESRTQCGETENDVCDGQGECEFRAAVDCGTAGVCETGFCCANTSGVGICGVNAFDCPGTQNNTIFRLKCDSASDCRSGEYCNLESPPVSDAMRSSKCITGVPDMEPKATYQGVHKTVCYSDSDCNLDPSNYCMENTGNSAQYISSYCWYQ